MFTPLSGDDAYDRVIVDDPDHGARPMPAAPATLAGDGAGLLAVFAATGPAANARTRTAGAARFAGAPLGLADAGPSWVPGRGTPRPTRTGREPVRRAATAVATATEAAATATAAAAGGDRGALIRRAAVPVPHPTIAVAEPQKVY